MKAAWAANRKAQVDCGEILWRQRGCLGGPHPQPLSHFAGEASQVDMPVRLGNEHPPRSRSSESGHRVDTAGARDQGRAGVAGSEAWGGRHFDDRGATHGSAPPLLLALD
jgi:hypothetical protein